VVYLGVEPIPRAAEAVTELRRRGVPVAFATNNASRSAAAVAELLTSVGIPAGPADVLTSAQATAEEVAARHPRGTRVLVVGAEALRDDLRAAGLAIVDGADAAPGVVVQGYGAHVGWADLAEACVAIRAGAAWVATNVDATLPSPRGPLPGNGSLVAAVRTALGREPDLVVGKPAPGLFQSAARRAGARRPLVVGDRLDTDVAGARHAGMDSLLVLTGVTDARTLLCAPADQRPTYLATDLCGLFTMDAEPAGWTARVTGDGVHLDGAGTPIDALRVLSRVAWSGTKVEPATPEAGEALRALGLAG
jgi:HAD superfamily hydrolase (TIGR01450 family)